jgi:hypothetical protein
MSFALNMLRALQLWNVELNETLKMPGAVSPEGLVVTSMLERNKPQFVVPQQRNTMACQSASIFHGIVLIS